MFLSFRTAFERMWRRGPHRLPLDARTRLVVFSDLHRGAGGRADDFLPNSELFREALEHYDRRRFTYVELGDGDELLENRGLEPIVRAHEDIFRVLDRFHRDGRLIYVFGNHNLLMSRPRWREKQLAAARTALPGLWKGLVARESILLGDGLILFHGHQADGLSTFLHPLSRVLIRCLWRYLRSSLGLKNRLSVSQNPRKRALFEKRVAAWAEGKRLAAVTGHTHRPVLSLSGRTGYINPGSGVRRGTVTALEIEGFSIRLAEWRLVPGPRGRVKSVRRVAAGGRADLRRIFSPKGGPPRLPFSRS